MKIIKKIQKKIQNEGFGKLITSAKDLVCRKARKKIFKFKASVRFKVFSKCKGYQFKPMPVNLSLTHPFELSNRDCLDLIASRKFKILSDEYNNYKSESGKISWNTDPVNDCFWPMNQWGIDTSIGYNQGDVKRPWELGRLHTLVELGVRYKQANTQDEKKRILQSAEGILKDFSSSNDFFYGPQWICAMDVGIRIANICLAADLFGEEFQKNNRELLSFELTRHLFFIENNLEFKNRKVVNNHFLGNLAGLVSILTHTENSRGIKNKLIKYANELVNQLEIQFLDDGGNFEGSTYYHRLSCELILFPLAGIMSFSNDVLKNAHVEKITKKFKRIYEFTIAIQDFENKVPQIGDNDSGHLFIFDSHQFEKNDLDFSGLISCMETFLESIGSKDLYGKMINSYLGKNQSTNRIKENLISNFTNEESHKKHNDHANKKNKIEYVFPFHEISLDRLRVSNFSSFGLVVIKSEEFYLAIRSGQTDTDIVGGHRHVDQLFFYLKTKDASTPRDPGSYCYTSNSKLRNIFRSAEVHNVPHVDGDCSLEDLDLFEMNKYNGQCLYLSQDKFLGMFTGNIDTYFRSITIKQNQLEVTDWSEQDLSLKPLDFKENYFSPRYGVWQEKK